MAELLSLKDEALSSFETFMVDAENGRITFDSSVEIRNFTQGFFNPLFEIVRKCSNPAVAKKLETNPFLYIWNCSEGGDTAELKTKLIELENSVIRNYKFRLINVII